MLRPRDLAVAVIVVFSVAWGDGIRAQTVSATSEASTRARPTRAPSTPSVKPTPDTLRFDHASDSVEFHDYRGRMLRRNSDSLASSPVRVPSDRPLVVVVEHANSLLYTYEVKADVVRPGQLGECRDLGSKALTRGVVSGVGLAANLSAPGSGRVVVPMLVDLLPGPSGGTRAPESVTIAAMKKQVSIIRAPILEFIDWSAKFDSLTAMLNEGLKRVAEWGETMPVDSLLDSLQHRAKEQADHLLHGLNQWGDIPWRAQMHVDSLLRTDSSVEVAHFLSAAVRRGDYQGSPQDSDAVEAVSLSKRADSALARLSASYRQLQVALHRIDAARARSQQEFVVPASTDVRRIALVLVPTKDDLFKDVARLKSDTIDVVTEPTASTPVCEIEVGVAWLWRPPSYAVSNGLVVDQAASVARLAFVLGIRLTLPHFPLVGLVGGLGIGAASSLDLFLGASVRPPVAPLGLRPGLIGGVAWQGEPKLPPGLKVGDSATPTALAGLQRAFRPRTFWGFSLGF